MNIPIQELVAYEAPRIVDTFEALEVMGAAEGLACGQGSQCQFISIPA